MPRVNAGSWRTCSASTSPPSATSSTSIQPACGAGPVCSARFQISPLPSLMKSAMREAVVRELLHVVGERAHAREHLVAAVLAREAGGDVAPADARAAVPLRFEQHRRLHVPRRRFDDERRDQDRRDGQQRRVRRTVAQRRVRSDPAEQPDGRPPNTAHAATTGIM